MPTPPTIADVHAEIEAQRFDAARALCERIVRADPKNGEALALAGLLCSHAGDDAVAADLLGKAIKQLPRRWDLYHNLGIVLRRMERLEEAALRFNKAIALNPQATAAHGELGHVLLAQRKIDEAIASLQRAVETSPDDAKFHAALGDALHESQRIVDATAAYERAIALDETIAAAWFGLGHIRLTANDVIRAAECFSRCVTHEPEMLRSWFGLGCAELAREDNVAAADVFERCLALEPAYGEAHQNLGNARFKLGDLDAAIGHYTQALALAERDPAGVRFAELARRSIAVAIPGWSKADHAAVRDARAAWGAMQRCTPFVRSRERTSERDRLRIGYISAFFGRDNWMKPVWGLVNQHNRERFHVHLFYDGTFYQRSADGAETANLPTAYRPMADDVVCNLTGVPNDAAAARIAEFGIDILIDLNGYSRMDRFAVFARRPAPVIAAWFNMFATTGVPWFDYLIGDAHMIRPEEVPFYTERVVFADGSYLTFRVDYPVPEVAPPPCIERGYVTFGCFASQYKLTDEVLAVFAEILRRCPGSRLLLKNADLGVASTCQYVLDKLSRLGVAADRITLSGPAEHFAFIDAYREVDVALDTFPYNGGTTTTEAIWQGVPVAAFDGDRWASRTSTTILREAGLGNWVARDLAGFIELAAAWGNAANVSARLAEMRRTMRDKLRASRVCDTRGFARSMEGLYEQMWAEHVAATRHESV
jgi:protein O-GlcNAc transferase